MKRARNIFRGSNIRGMERIYGFDEYAIDIEEDKFYLFCARFAGWKGHGGRL